MRLYWTIVFWNVPFGAEGMSRFLCPQIFISCWSVYLYRTLTPLTLQKSLGSPQAPRIFKWSSVVPVQIRDCCSGQASRKRMGKPKDEALAVIAKTLLELLQQGSWQSSVYPTGWLGESWSEKARLGAQCTYLQFTSRIRMDQTSSY